jgi:pantothenate synthetase
VIFAEQGVDVDYLEIVDPDDLTPLAEAKEGSVLLVAARVGNTRLLDNTVLGVDEAWLHAGSIAPS